jgi:hypothetical protein
MSSKTIFLTGRKQIKNHAYFLDLQTKGSKSLLVLGINDKELFKNYPISSRIFVYVSDKNNFHRADYGTIGKQSSLFEIDSNISESATYCLRIISDEDSNRYKVLASSTYKSIQGSQQNNSGILFFIEDDIGQLVWKLNTREDEFPTLCLNKNLNNSVKWAKNNQTFRSTVFPTVIEKVWIFIFKKELIDRDWVLKWIEFSQGYTSDDPPFEGTDENQEVWINSLVEKVTNKSKWFDLLKEDLESNDR